MKLRLVNTTELILALVFIISGILLKIAVIDLTLFLVPSALVLGILYFPMGFYTLKSPGVHYLNLLFYGAIFSLAILAMMLTIMKTDLGLVLLIVMLSGFLLVAGYRAFAVYMFDAPWFLDYSNAVSIRYLILFVLMAYLFVTYKFR